MTKPKGDGRLLLDLMNLDRAMTPFERRLLTRKKPRTPRGYAALPGTGPDGETCKSCEHIVRLAYGKVYRKCGLMEHIWTGGPRSDILAGAPACRRWEAKKEDGNNG